MDPERPYGLVSAIVERAFSQSLSSYCQTDNKGPRIASGDDESAVPIVCTCVFSASRSNTVAGQ